MVAEIYGDFILSMSSKRGSNEPFRNIEAGLQYQVDEFSTHSYTTEQPNGLLVFMIPANSGLENNQRVSVLAAVKPRVDGELSRD